MIQEQPSLRRQWLPLMLMAFSAGRCGESYPNQQSASRPTTTREVRAELASGSHAGDSWLPGDPGLTDILFEIHTQLSMRPISPLIYGINYDLRDTQTQRWGVIRGGGNRFTAYNWETNASNAGSDFHFQNDSLVSESDEPAAPLLKIIDAAASVEASAIITLANSDYVAADKNGGGDVRATGTDYLRSRFNANHASKHSAFSPAPDLNDRHV